MDKLGMEGYVRPSISEALHGHSEEAQRVAREESLVHRTLSRQEKEEMENDRKVRRYAAGLIIAITAVIFVVIFLYPRNAHGQVSSEALEAVTFVPTKEKLKDDPLLLPLDVFRVKDVKIPDAQYRSVAKKLQGLGFKEAGIDRDPPEFRGKCVVLPVESFYRLACRGMDVEQRLKVLEPNLPYRNFEEVLVMMRSFSRDLQFSYLKRSPQQPKTVPQSRSPLA